MLPGLPAWCVGDKTAQTAQSAGFDARSAAGDSEDLVAMILSGDRPSAPLIHLHGEHTRGDVAARLTAAGVPCQSLALYAQVPSKPTEAARDALSGETPVILPLFSPRSAAIMAGFGGLTAPLHIIAMSDAVAKEARVLDPDTLVVADQPTAAAMVAATARGLRVFAQG